MSYTTEMLRAEDHRDAVLSLWAHSMSESRIAQVGAKRFEWLYGRNPVGPAHTCVGIHVESGGVIGCASFIPRRVAIDGRLADGGMLCDFAVDKMHRTAGPALAIQRALAKDSVASGLEFLYGYPNEKSLPIFKRLRYLVIGQARTWVKPLRSEYKVRERLDNPLLIKATSVVVDVGLRAKDAQVFLRRPCWCRTEITERADHRFDELWERVRPSLITGEKDSAYMNWRYAEHTTNPHRFCLVLHRGELIGYAVYTVRDNKVFVAEIFCDLHRDIGQVLFAFARRMRRDRHDSIVVQYAGNDLLSNAVQADNYLLRPGERTLLAYVDKSAPVELRERLSDLQSWYLFDGELDV